MVSSQERISEGQNTRTSHQERTSKSRTNTTEKMVNNIWEKSNASVSVNEVMRSINHTTKKAGTPYNSFITTKTSWDDVDRNILENGQVSCGGNNITDTKLFAEDDTNLFVVRPELLNEKVGKTSADLISVVANEDGESKLVTLKEFLIRAGV